jgi:hypothetical protein
MRAIDVAGALARFFLMGPVAIDVAAIVHATIGSHIRAMLTRPLPMRTGRRVAGTGSGTVRAGSRIMRTRGGMVSIRSGTRRTRSGMGCRMGSRSATSMLRLRIRNRRHRDKQP